MDLLTITDLEVAKEKVLANRARAAEASRTAAMERLREVLAGYSFSQADVVTLWETDQVRRVMDT